jgi:predicted nucleic acid-binding protein
MILADILTGEAVFVDTNIFIYYLRPDPVLGAACGQMLQRIENGDLKGCTSAHVVSEMAHRLMTDEAVQRFGWPVAGIARRLRNHPAQIAGLSRHQQGIDELSLIGIRILPVTGSQVSIAADLSRRHGLLSGDALVVAVMQHHGLTALASHDADFDRVPGLTRYAPA